MALIPRPSLAFYSVLFVLMGLALGQDFCEIVVENFFTYARDKASRLKSKLTVPLDDQNFQVVFDDVLIKMMVLVNKKPSPRAGREFVFQKDIDFGVPAVGYRSVTLKVRHHRIKDFTGKFHVYCKGAECEIHMNRLKQVQSYKQLTCMVKNDVQGVYPVYQYFMSMNSQNAIEVGVPYEIVQAEDIVRNVVMSQGPTDGVTWTSGTCYVQNDRLIFEVEGGIILRVELHLESYSYLVLDYIESACKALALKKVSLSFTTVPKTAVMVFASSTLGRSAPPEFDWGKYNAEANEALQKAGIDEELYGEMWGKLTDKVKPILRAAKADNLPPPPIDWLKIYREVIAENPRMAPITRR